MNYNLLYNIHNVIVYFLGICVQCVQYSIVQQSIVQYSIVGVVQYSIVGVVQYSVVQ